MTIKSRGGSDYSEDEAMNSASRTLKWVLQNDLSYDTNTLKNKFPKSNRLTNRDDAQNLSDLTQEDMIGSYKCKGRNVAKNYQLDNLHKVADVAQEGRGQNRKWTTNPSELETNSYKDLVFNDFGLYRKLRGQIRLHEGKRYFVRRGSRRKKERSPSKASDEISKYEIVPDKKEEVTRIQFVEPQIDDGQWITDYRDNASDYRTSSVAYSQRTGTTSHRKRSINQSNQALQGNIRTITTPSDFSYAADSVVSGILSEARGSSKRWFKESLKKDVAFRGIVEEGVVLTSQPDLAILVSDHQFTRRKKLAVDLNAPDLHSAKKNFSKHQRRLPRHSNKTHAPSEVMLSDGFCAPNAVEEDFKLTLKSFVKEHYSSKTLKRNVSTDTAEKHIKEKKRSPHKNISNLHECFTQTQDFEGQKSFTSIPSTSTQMQVSNDELMRENGRKQKFRKEFDDLFEKNDLLEDGFKNSNKKGTSRADFIFEGDHLKRNPGKNATFGNGLEPEIKERRRSHFERSQIQAQSNDKFNGNKKHLKELQCTSHQTSRETQRTQEILPSPFKDYEKNVNKIVNSSQCDSLNKMSKGNSLFPADHGHRRIAHETESSSGNLIEIDFAPSACDFSNKHTSGTNAFHPRNALARQNSPEIDDKKEIQGEKNRKQSRYVTPSPKIERMTHNEKKVDEYCDNECSAIINCKDSHLKQQTEKGVLNTPDANDTSREKVFEERDTIKMNKESSMSHFGKETVNVDLEKPADMDGKMQQETSSQCTSSHSRCLSSSEWSSFTEKNESASTTKEETEDILDRGKVKKSGKTVQQDTSSTKPREVFHHDKRESKAMTPCTVDESLTSQETASNSSSTIKDMEETLSDKFKRWENGCKSSKNSSRDDANSGSTSVSSKGISKEMLKKFNSGAAMASMIYGSPKPLAKNSILDDTAIFQKDTHQRKKWNKVYTQGANSDSEWTFCNDGPKTSGSANLLLPQPVCESQYENLKINVQAKMPIMNPATGNSFNFIPFPQDNGYKSFGSPAKQFHIPFIEDSANSQVSNPVCNIQGIAPSYPMCLNAGTVLNPSVFIPQVSCNYKPGVLMPNVPFQNSGIPNQEYYQQLLGRSLCNFMNPEFATLLQNEGRRITSGKLTTSLETKTLPEPIEKPNKIPNQEVSSVSDSNGCTSDSNISSPVISSKANCNLHSSGHTNTDNHNMNTVHPVAGQVANYSRQEDETQMRKQCVLEAETHRSSNKESQYHPRDISKVIALKSTSGKDMASVLYGASWDGSRSITRPLDLKTTNSESYVWKCDAQSKQTEKVSRKEDSSQKNEVSSVNRLQGCPRRPKGIVPCLEVDEFWKNDTRVTQNPTHEMSNQNENSGKKKSPKACEHDEFQEPMGDGTKAEHEADATQPEQQQHVTVKLSVLKEQFSGIPWEELLSKLQSDSSCQS